MHITPFSLKTHFSDPELDNVHRTAFIGLKTAFFLIQNEHY